MNDPLRQTLMARVYDVAIETPLQLAKKISDEKDANIYLKREDLQPIHSFKIRGAYNKIYHLSKKSKSKGIIAASAGNHAQGVALSAKILGISSVIVMPVTTPSIKVESVKMLGAEVVLFGDSYSDAYKHAMDLMKSLDRTFVHPFDDPLVIAGQGTIGREIIEQLPEVTHIFVPIGGGGLIAGIAQFVKTLNKNIRIIGIEPDDSNAMGRSIAASRRIKLADVGIFADGVAVKQVGKHTFDIARKYVDNIITVNTDQICAAIKELFEETRSIIEPAGALAYAAISEYKFPKDTKVVAICSGANITFERLQQVAERTMIGSGKEALFAIKMPEKAGALLSFCQKVLNAHSITEFNYRLSNRNDANVLVGVSVINSEDKSRFKKKMNLMGFEHTDLTHNAIAKEHVRHMIGGQSTRAINEHFYQIDFPERPGALSNFLTILGNNWNISAFHYRNAASDTGNVLLGIEAEDKAVLETAISLAGYQWRRVEDDISLKIFIK